MDEQDLREIIYIKSRISWIDHYVSENHKEIKTCKADIFRLTEEKQVLTDKLNNSLHKK